MRIRDGSPAEHIMFAILAVMMLLLWFFVAALSANTLQIMVAPRQGIAPLYIRVDVRQDPATVSGREVCIHVDGPDIIPSSCWTSDNPTPLVTRYFTLDPGGAYKVWAASRQMQSERVTINVLDGGSR